MNLNNLNLLLLLLLSKFAHNKYLNFATFYFFNQYQYLFSTKLQL